MQLNGCISTKLVVPSFHLEIYLQRERKIMMQDAIIREVTFKATSERVYKVMTDPAEIVKWFPDSVEEGTLEVGQEPFFAFKEYGVRHRILVVAANPSDYFAFRWAPGLEGSQELPVTGLPNTLVEFLIEAQGETTKVTIKESGFASLPSRYAAKSHEENSGGWEYMADRLEKLLS